MTRLRNLSNPSRRLADAVFARFPEIRGQVRAVAVDGSEEREISVIIPSPTGSEELEVEVWMEVDGNRREARLRFGPWHVHGSIDEEKRPADDWQIVLADLAKILADEWVLLAIRDPEDRSWVIVDIGPYDDLLDQMRRSSLRMRIQSWSGKRNHETG